MVLVTIVFLIVDFLDSVNKHVDRQYVTTHQLQWKHKQQKLMKGRSPEIVGRRITRSKDAEQERGSVKRKLQLEGNTSDDQESGADEMIAEQVQLILCIRVLT